LCAVSMLHIFPTKELFALSQILTHDCLPYVNASLYPRNDFLRNYPSWPNFVQNEFNNLGPF
jgi:hypothetical protein